MDDNLKQIEIMTKQEILDKLRDLVSQLDNTAQQCLEMIEEQDMDEFDYELEHLMHNVQNEVTEYQERMGYI
jgi:predicted transcriptional regulator